jgi:hypothetical protein
MENLGGNIFNESLSKISDMINGPKTDVKTLQDATLAFDKENAKGEDADLGKLAELGQILKVQVDAANASSAGSGFMIAEATGVKDIEKQLADAAKRIALGNFDMTGVVDVKGDKERAGIAREYEQKKSEIIGGPEGQRKMDAELAANRTKYEEEMAIVKASAPTPQAEAARSAALRENFRQSNSEIRKEDELGALQQEYRGKIVDTRLDTRIGEGAKGESEGELDKLSEEKERVVQTIQSLNSDIETFGNQFKAGDGKSFMKGVQQIDDALKRAAENVEDLAGVSAAMDRMNKQTISTIEAATEAVKRSQDKITNHENEFEAVNKRISGVERDMGRFTSDT